MSPQTARFICYQTNDILCAVSATQLTQEINIMTTHTPTNMTLIDRINSVLVDGDTSKDITDKIVNKYPEVFEIKVSQRGNDKDAYTQLRGEISSLVSRAEGTLFTMDRNQKPYTYSFICDKTDDDTDDLIEYTTDEIDIGYVYILDTHLDIDGERIYKIGKANDIEKRVHQLDNEQGSY